MSPVKDQVPDGALIVSIGDECLFSVIELLDSELLNGPWTSSPSSLQEECTCQSGSNGKAMTWQSDLTCRRLHTNLIFRSASTNSICTCQTAPVLIENEVVRARNNFETTWQGQDKAQSRARSNMDVATVPICAHTFCFRRLSRALGSGLVTATFRLGLG